MNVGVYIAEMFSTGNDAAKRAVITEELDLRALGLRAEQDAQWRAAPWSMPARLEPGANIRRQATPWRHTPAPRSIAEFGPRDPNWTP
jgi:hypothetical protein